jgi:hypothetical protein
VFAGLIYGRHTTVKERGSHGYLKRRLGVLDVPGRVAGVDVTALGRWPGFTWT